MEKCYIISYDLPEGTDYNPLYKAMKSYKAWAMITESTWAIVGDDDAVTIRNHLKLYIPSGGRLFVIRSGKESAWVNTICKNEWLQENL